MLKAAAVGTALASVGIYFYLKGSDGKAPNYSKDSTTWYAFGSDGKAPMDLFYAHPTTEVGLLRWNMNWQDKGTVCTGLVAGDPDLIVGQASAWSDNANVYAPKYRQQGFLAMGQDLEHTDVKHNRMKESLDLAAGDLQRAFEHFLAARPDKTRPYIIAAHSQGAILMSRVIAQSIEGNTEASDTFVAAYLAGGYLPLDLFGTVYHDVHACTGPLDTKCIVSYDTRTESFKPESMNKMFGSIGVWPHHLHWLLHDKYCSRPEGQDPGKPRLQINPMTWSSASGGIHLGASLTSTMIKPPAGKTSKDILIPPRDWGAKTIITGYSVQIPNPDTWWPGASHAGGEGNLHPVDVQFWYENIRTNVAERVEAWTKLIHTHRN